MDAMYSAIKSRRGGMMGGQQDNNAPQVPEGKPQGKSDGMQTLVAALSDDQKNQLLSILVKDQGSGKDSQSKPNATDPNAIDKGGMGPGEQEETDEQSQNDNNNDLGGDHESEDQIAQSMISSSDQMRSGRGDSPRNLGE